MNEQEEVIEKYYAISKNDNDRITNHFPQGKTYAEGWLACVTNKSFIEANEIKIVSERWLKILTEY